MNPISQSPKLLADLAAAIEAEKLFHFMQGFQAGADAMFYFLTEQPNLTITEVREICRNHQIITFGEAEKDTSPISG